MPIYIFGGLQTTYSTLFIFTNSTITVHIYLVYIATENEMFSFPHLF